jgi:hypothetical protein
MLLMWRERIISLENVCGTFNRKQGLPDSICNPKSTDAECEHGGHKAERVNTKQCTTDTE